MTTDPLDEYVRRLERELRRRGFDDRRTLDEARDHLVDAIEDGRRRGLSDDDAASDAFERFGAPEVVAAHVVSEGEGTMGPAAVFRAVWHHKWWLLVPTVVTAITTSLLSYHFLPIRYQSESVIQVSSPRISADYVRSTVPGDVRERIATIRQIVTSRTRLENVINEFGLYQAEREKASIEDLVEQLRRDITVNLVAPSDEGERDLSGFRVSFESSDPQLAMKVTQRLTAMILQENLQRRQVDVESTARFVEVQIADVRRRIIASEKTLGDLRQQSGGRALSQADLLPYEVLLDQYKALLLMSEQSRMAISAERRLIGEQFRVIAGARVPERPIGPSRASINAGGMVTGLVLGLVAIGVRGRSTVAGA